MAQICTPVLALIMLCTIGLFSSEAAAVRRSACCTMYSSLRVPKDAIKGFTIQTKLGKCNIDAVILHTTKDKKICVDPYLPWVTSIIENLKKQFQVIRANRHNSQ